MEKMETTASKYDLEYVLEQMERIASDTAYLLEAVRNCGASSDGSGMAIGNIVESREKTNQKLIDFYQQMYKDLKPSPASGKDLVVAEMLKTLNDPARSAEDKERAKTVLQNYMLS